MYSSTFLALAAFATTTLAQGTEWAQCGGEDFCGPTTCVAGYTCVYSNPWYSQCLPETASSAVAPVATSSNSTWTASVNTTSPSATTVAPYGNSTLTAPVYTSSPSATPVAPYGNYTLTAPVNTSSPSATPVAPFSNSTWTAPVNTTFSSYATPVAPFSNSSLVAPVNTASSSVVVPVVTSSISTWAECGYPESSSAVSPVAPIPPIATFSNSTLAAAVNTASSSVVAPVATSSTSTWAAWGYSASFSAVAPVATSSTSTSVTPVQASSSSAVAPVATSSTSTPVAPVQASSSSSTAPPQTTLVTSVKAVISISSTTPAITSVNVPSGGSQTSQCGQYETQTAGPYFLYSDLWAEDSASSGSQCSSVDAYSDSAIGWTTSWSWAGGQNSVKSYTNVVLNQDTIQKLSAISSIPTSWSWSYSGTSVVADVSYDMFLSSTADGSREYEIMVWLGALGGAGPISSTGQPASTPTIGGTTFDMYSGPNGDTTVYSFVATSKDVTSYTGDLIDFFNYLEQSYGVNSDLYLQSIGAGTEPFTGSDAVLKVSSYSVSVS